MYIIFKKDISNNYPNILNYSLRVLFDFGIFIYPCAIAKKMQVQILSPTQSPYLLTTFNRFLLGFFFRFSNFQGIFFCRGNSDNEWLIVVFNILGRASSIGTLAICYIYSAEIFPTVVRNVGIGSSSVWVISKKKSIFQHCVFMNLNPFSFG